MQRNLTVRKNAEQDEGGAQMRRILNFYVDCLKDDEEKRFDCLHKDGFIDALRRRSATFDEFSANIDRVAEERNYQDHSAGSNAVSNLKEHWFAELKDIRLCLDCYEYFTFADTNPNYFTLVCKKPHLLVFVKETKDEGPRMWPAKVLSANYRKKKVTIECFGDYLRADWAFTKCYLYSEAQEKKRKLLNVKFSKDPAIGKQEEYKATFAQVQDYIENIKSAFETFVPAATKQTITDVDKHLLEMYPRAFGTGRVSTDIVQPRPLAAGNKSVMRLVSLESSQSHHSLRYDGSSHGSDDLNETDDSAQHSLEERLIQIELPTVDFKIEQVEEDISDFHDEANNESPFETETESGDATTGEEASDGPKIIRKGNRKRRNVNTVHPAVMKKRPLRAPKGRSKASEFGHSSNDDEVVTIADEDEDDTQTTSQNPNEPVTNGGNAALLHEFADVKVRISECEQQLLRLKAQEVTIEKKILNAMIK